MSMVRTSLSEASLSAKAGSSRGGGLGERCRRWLWCFCFGGRAVLWTVFVAVVERAGAGDGEKP